MNKSKFLSSVAAFFALTMAVAYPWHMVLFHEKYVAMGALTRGEPIIPFGMLAIILQGAVFAYFYPLYYRHRGGGASVLRGIQFALFLGLTVWTVMVLATAAKFAIEPVWHFIFLGTAFQILQFVLTGAAIGWIHGRNGVAMEHVYDDHPELKLLIDHVSLSVVRLERAKDFYVKALAPLGIEKVGEVSAKRSGTVASVGFGIGRKGSFWLVDEGTQAPQAHVCFRAPSRAVVDAFYDAAIAAGGRDNGPPGTRPKYHPDYYAAYVLDPEGHNIEAVCFGP